jgi:hypothetical protein
VKGYDYVDINLLPRFPLDKLIKVLLRKATCSAQMKNVLDLAAD